MHGRSLVTEGFEAFRRGTFGNGGHNLYVSRAGILQRIHQYDLNADGFVELVFSNSHDYWETAPSTLVRRASDGTFASSELWTAGATSAAIGDLTGDGWPDLVVGRQFDGVSFDVNAIVYYGSERGWGEHAIQYLPAPGCVGVAVGDFDGSGRPAIAFLLGDRVRVYRQTELAFEAHAHLDLPIVGDDVTAADLDGDGCAELLVRGRDGSVAIHWGGPDGLRTDRASSIPGPLESPRPTEQPALGDVAARGLVALQPAAALESVTSRPHPLVRVVSIGGRPHVFVAGPTAARLVPVERDRTFGPAIEIACSDVRSVAVADLDGDGAEDLVVAVGAEDGASSWIYWGDPRDGPGEWTNDRRTALPVERACDIAVADLDGDGRPEIAMARFHSDVSFTVECPIFGLTGRDVVARSAVAAHDPRRALAIPRRRAGGADADADQPADVLFLGRYGRSRSDSGAIDIYLGGADGYSPDRVQRVPSWGACVSVCADFDDDGRVDLAIANAAETDAATAPGAYVYRNDGPGFAPRLAQILPPNQAHGIACADLDRDGYLDLVLAAMSEPEILVYRGGPHGFDLEHPRRIRLELDGETFANQRFIQLVDLNGDGWLDLFVPTIDSPHSLILWGGPDGFSIERSQKLAVWHPCSAGAADLDGDGLPELIVGGHTASNSGPHDSWAYIYWNGPDGFREDRRTLLPGEAINSISIADFNNDGNLDLFVSSYQDGRKRRDIDSYIYWNRGDRRFSSRDFTRLFTHSASGDFAADLDEDGWVDLVTAHHKIEGDHLGDSQIWWNGPDGFDDRRVTRLPTRGPHGMVTPGPGNILDRGPEEFYVSEVFELAAGERPSGIRWDADLGPKTWVRAQIRTAERADGLERAAWRGASAGAGGAGDGWLENGAAIREAPSGGVVQYRLALGATNSGSTPRIRRVTIETAHA